VKPALKIISGGQAGADRSALDVALENGLEIGGFVPAGRWAEDGTVSSNYKGLTETDSTDPSERTRLNVITSDATLIFSHGKLSGGSLLTWKVARSERRPCLHIDLDRNSDDAAVEKILLWLRTSDIRTLNIAGPRASKDPDIYAGVKRVLAPRSLVNTASRLLRVCAVDGLVYCVLRLINHLRCNTLCLLGEIGSHGLSLINELVTSVAH
jgi:hypothetical protein